MEGIPKMDTGIEKDDRPKYDPPAVKTYSGDDLLEELGPAQAIYGTPPFP